MIYYSGITYKDGKLQNFSRPLAYFKEYLNKNKNSLGNYVPLVTCNRIELYTGKPAIIKGFNQKKGKKALKHLFGVAAGIDSMVIGENEVSVQVREAYLNSKKENHCSAGLDLAFNKALKTAKKIRSKTKINHGRVSLASISVEFAIGRYNPKRVLVIGSGMLAAKIAKALSRKNIGEIILSNRHLKRAKDLAKKLGCSADKLDNLKEMLKYVNVVFSATSCPLPVIYKKDIPPNREIAFIDLAVPYDVDKEVRNLKGIEVISLDCFRKIINKNRQEKRKEIKKAKDIINKEVETLELI